MKLTLAVYRGADVEKTYEADETAVTVGVVQDVFRMVEVDKLAYMDDPKVANEVTASLLRAFMDFLPVAKRLFPGLTDEEFGRCLPRDVGRIMLGVVTFAVGELMGASPKNRKA